MCLRSLCGVVILLASIPALCTDVPASYSSQCTPCHAIDGKAVNSAKFKTQIPDLRSRAVQDLTDTELFESIARGTRHREYPHAFIYRGLKDADIRELVKYIRTLPKMGK